MKRLENLQKVTFGGEAEVMPVNRQGMLVPMDKDNQARVQERVNGVTDLRGKPMDVGYDSSEHLVEIGAGVHDTLSGVVLGLKDTIIKLQQEMTQSKDSKILSMSHHPLEEAGSAYQRVIKKPMYDLLRGPYQGETVLHQGVLTKVYPTEPERGRGWKHESGTMSASLQPWNSLTVEEAANQIATLQATGWMFNLLGANSIVAEGAMTGKRDTRLEMWGENGFLSTSRYASDRQLNKNIPEQPRGLADYYHFIYSNQRPMAVPYLESEQGKEGQYKVRFMAIMQPPDETSYNMLDYLRSDSVKAVDVETGEEMDIQPSVSHLFNGFDFQYFPRYGARLRVNLPKAERINPKAFADAIEQRDEETVQKLFIQGGIKEGGFVCAEGRVSATVLPTKDTPDWEGFALPFVLQTGILRKHDEVMHYLEQTGLSWQDLAHQLPEMTNDIQQGFASTVNNRNVTSMAKDIWAIAKSGLEEKELALVGNKVDTILEREKAPAEEQKEVLEEEMQINYAMTPAVIGLIDRFSME